MVIDQDKSNVIHVLTSNPLELHSYYPVNIFLKLLILLKYL